MLLAGCPSLVRKGNEIAGRDIRGMVRYLAEAGSRVCVNTSLTQTLKEGVRINLYSQT